MPGMDGFETAGQIKQRGRTPDVPIIFLTAAGADPELAFRGYAAGAVDYISKPFDPWVLRAKVSVFVDLYLKDRQLALWLLPTLLPGCRRSRRPPRGLAGAARGALASGTLTDTALTDGLARLDGAIATLRSTLSGLGVGRAPRARGDGRLRPGRACRVRLPRPGARRATAASRPRCARGRSSRARPPPRSGRGPCRGPPSPAATTTLRPMLAPGSTIAPAPSHEPAPMLTGRLTGNWLPIGMSGSS